MSTFAAIYAAAWTLAIAFAAVLAVRERVELLDAAYWRWLAQPWKLATFALAGGAVYDRGIKVIVQNDLGPEGLADPAKELRRQSPSGKLRPRLVGCA